MTITLDEETHVYRVEGRIVRGFHEMMAPLGLWDEYAAIRDGQHGEYRARALANAKARGSQIDDACSLIMEGKYTPEHDALLSDEARPYVDAYREFWATIPGIPGERRGLCVQTPLYSATLDFCCTPDWHTSMSVTDIKATSKCSRTWGLQTAAQQLAHGSASDRRIIWLRPDLKGRKYEAHSGQYMNRRIFSALDFDVVKAAAQGDYDADCIRRWRAGG